MRRTLISLFVTLLAFFLGCAGLWAQATAQISGTVRDQSGAVLPGVEVTATQADTGMQGILCLYSFPASRKLKYPVLLKMMWSSSSMPTISPAALSWAVMLMSLCDGSTPPLG